MDFSHKRITRGDLPTSVWMELLPIEPLVAVANNQGSLARDAMRNVLDLVRGSRPSIIGSDLIRTNNALKTTFGNQVDLPELQNYLVSQGVDENLMIYEHFPSNSYLLSDFPEELQEYFRKLYVLVNFLNGRFLIGELQYRGKDLVEILKGVQQSLPNLDTHLLRDFIRSRGGDLRQSPRNGWQSIDFALRTKEREEASKRQESMLAMQANQERVKSLARKLDEEEVVRNKSRRLSDPKTERCMRMNQQCANPPLDMADWCDHDEREYWETNTSSPSSSSQRKRCFDLSELLQFFETKLVDKKYTNAFPSYPKDPFTTDRFSIAELREIYNIARGRGIRVQMLAPTFVRFMKFLDGLEENERVKWDAQEFNVWKIEQLVDKVL